MCWSIDANSAEALSIADSMMVSNPDLSWIMVLLISSRTVLLKIQTMASYFSVFFWSSASEVCLIVSTAVFISARNSLGTVTVGTCGAFTVTFGAGIFLIVSTIAF